MIKASFGLTETGAVRRENQDSYLLDVSNGVFAVADGLGGLPNGAKASKLTLDILERKLSGGDQANLLDIVTEVNAETREVGYAMSASGFGTTLTALRLLPEDKLMQIAHVGDSAAYLVRGHKVETLTREHTVAARMIEERWQDASDAIPLSAHHTLTQCIGQDLYIDPNIVEMPLQSGDRVFLLTDGATKPIPESVLHETLRSGDSLSRIGQTLSFKVEAAGAPDNYTIVAIEID